MIQQQMEACLEACMACLRACNECFDACLREEHTGRMAECIRLDRECAEICSLAISAMTRNSPFTKEICKLCARICEACGNECSKHDHDHCRTCAEACFACAKACAAMAE